MHKLQSTKNSVLLIILISLEFSKYDAFTPLVVNFKHSWFVKETESLIPMKLAGMGMGMAKSTKKKGGSKKQKIGNPSFDVSKSLLKSEKSYEKLCDDASKALNSDDDNISMVSEYVIAARGAPTKGIPISVAVSDWVPVAQLCIKRPIGYESKCSPREDRIVKMAISHFRREVWFAASLAAPIFNTIPRNTIQYSVEPFDSFQKFVYDEVIEGGKNQNANNGMSMTKADARKVLNLAEDCNNPQEIKKAYRNLLFSLHPDRFVGIDRSEDEVQSASSKYSEVGLAYDSLNSGVRSSGNNVSALSWYESLGGRSRTEFSGTIEMIPVDNKKDSLIEGHACAIAGLTSEVVMAFVARNQASSP